MHQRTCARRGRLLRRAERLLDEQLDDGGWNCEAPGSSRSSFNTTICVLEGLLEHELAAGPVAEVTAARLRGQEHLRVAGAVALVASRRGRDGRWVLDHRHPGDVPFQMEAASEPSRWITLRALRVLDWADGA